MRSSSRIHKKQVTFILTLSMDHNQMLRHEPHSTVGYFITVLPSSPFTLIVTNHVTIFGCESIETSDSIFLQPPPTPIRLHSLKTDFSKQS